MGSIGLTLATFALLDWAIVVAYLGVMLAIGAWASRGQKDDKSYFLADRQMPVWAVTLSVLATSLSAATYIGAPQAAFNGDLSYLILNLGGILGVIVVAGLFLPPLYRAGTVTIYGYLGKRFGANAQVGAGVTFLVGRVFASSARLFIAGIAFSLLLFDSNDTKLWHVIAAIALFGTVGTAYTCLGGIKAVIWTDTLQIVFVIGAALLSIGVLLHRIPLSPGEIIEVLRTAGPDGASKMDWFHSGFEQGGFDIAATYTLVAAFAMTFFNTAAYGTDQDLVQRMMTTRSPWRASLSVIGAQLIGLPVVGLFMVIGLLLSVYFGMPEVMGENAPGPISDSRKVYPQFLVNHLPMGLSGLAMAGLFAAAMSSLDSAINAMAGSALHDVKVLGRRMPAEAGTPQADGVKASRAMVVVMGAVLTVVAMGAAWVQQQGNEDLVVFALGVMSFAYSGLLGVFAAALFTRRGNSATVIAALSVGALVVLALQPWVLGDLTEAWWGEDERVVVSFAYWVPLGAGAAFLVCVMGEAKKGASRD